MASRSRSETGSSRAGASAYSGFGNDTRAFGIPTVSNRSVRARYSRPIQLTLKRLLGDTTVAAPLDPCVARRRQQYVLFRCVLGGLDHRLERLHGCSVGNVDSSCGSQSRPKPVSGIPLARMHQLRKDSSVKEHVNALLARLEIGDRPTCGSCACFQPAHDGATGRCRRYASMKRQVEECSECRVSWPLVDKYRDWCRNHVEVAAN